MEVPGRVCFGPRFQGIRNDDENAAEELAPSPGNSRRDLGAHGVAELAEELEGHGHERETRGAQDGQHDVRAREVARRRHEDEREVREPDQRHSDLDGEEEGLSTVEDRRRDGARDEPDEDQHGTGDAGVVGAETVG